MRRFEARLLVAVMSLSIFVTACGHRSGQTEGQAFDRAAAVTRMQARLARDEAWNERYRPLAARKKKGEDVSAELESLSAERPSLTDLKDDALRIIDANPDDDAAFQAVGIVLRINDVEDMTHWQGSEKQALQERMLHVLLEHHVHRPDLLNVIYANFSSDADSIAFWEKVFDAGPAPEVRAAVAYKLAKSHARWLDEIDLSPEQRQVLRRQAQHYAGILRDDYKSVNPALASEADKLLAALDYSPGATLPGIAVKTISGGPDSLTNYRGKIVLLDFWATWCGACRKDHPKLVVLKRELAGKPFEIISISTDESPDLVAHYMTKEISLPWPQWYVGPQGSVLKAWGISGYPTYLLVDADGVIQARGVTTNLDDIQDHARGLVARLEIK